MDAQPASRGLRLMAYAAAIVMLRFVGEFLLALAALVGSQSLGSLLRWAARLQFAHAAGTTLLIIGIAMNLGELRRRRQSLGAPIAAIGALTLALLFHVTLYQLLSGERSALTRSITVDDLPAWYFLATFGYLGGLLGITVMIRGYAIADDNQGLRELARNVGGWIAALGAAELVYRFVVFGTGMLGGILVAFGMLLFWAHCHRLFGRLVDTARYFENAAASRPRAEVIRDFDAAAAPTRARPASTPRAAPTPYAAPTAPPPVTPAPPPIDSAPIAPIAAAAPDRGDEAPTPSADGPRFLR